MFRLHDMNPGNFGYDCVRKSWVIIDAGCCKDAGGEMPKEAMWDKVFSSLSLGRFTATATRGSPERLRAFMSTVMGRYLATGNAIFTDQEVNLAIDLRATHTVEYKARSLAATGLPPNSATAQELRQGEEADDQRLAAGISQGAPA